MKKRAKVDWPAVAERMSALIPRQRLEPAVLRWIDTSPSRATWSVAFSGGPDSLALLLVLWGHWRERRARLQALHFDHRLRGAASRADAKFCRDVCAGLGIKFITEGWTGARRNATEAEARAARMAFFAKHARIVFLGHQQDDIAETMLMRLARGSGAGGLAAPRPAQPLPAGRLHLRPLLALKKAEIVAALRSVGVRGRDDATNSRGVFFRNRVRKDVVPAWITAAERDALAGAARSRQLLEEDDRALDEWLDELAPLDLRRRRLDLEVLAGKPRALLRRALHRWLLVETRVGDISRQAVDALLAAMERGAATRHSVGKGGFAVIRAGELHFERAGKRRRTFRRRPN